MGTSKSDTLRYLATMSPWLLKTAHVLYNLQPAFSATGPPIIQTWFRLAASLSMSIEAKPSLILSKNRVKIDLELTRSLRDFARRRYYFGVLPERFVAIRTFEALWQDYEMGACFGCSLNCCFYTTEVIWNIVGDLNLAQAEPKQSWPQHPETVRTRLCWLRNIKWTDFGLSLIINKARPIRQVYKPILNIVSDLIIKPKF